MVRFLQQDPMDLPPESPMDDLSQLFCCVPVFLLWFGPGALVVFCLGFDGCERIRSLWHRPPTSHRDPPVMPSV